MTLVEANRQILISLAGLDPETFSIVKEPIETSNEQVTLVVTPVEINLPMSGLVDVEAERQRLEKELQEAEAQIKRLEKLLASPFSQKAPPEVVQNEREKLQTYRETVTRINQQLG